MSPEHTVVLPHDYPHYRRAFILFVFLRDSLIKLNSQYERIEQNKSTQDTTKLPILFGDIHFFFITAGNLNKLLMALVSIFPEDASIKEIYLKHSSLLKKLSELRNHLEHILDGRLDGMGARGKVPLTEPNMLGNLFGDVYNFGGEKVNLVEAIEDIRILGDEMSEWNRRTGLYPL